jgi:TolB-like protein
MSAPTVFLSYASEDRETARTIGAALPAYGLEVWYDESELGGGDAWDQKIRKQIRDCDYFIALVSARTEARHEGYFRREWRLAVERTLDMADDHTFLLPIVIDDTDQASARVPEKFLAVQWLRVPGGTPTPALEALCRRLVSGEAAAPPAAKKESPRRVRAERVSAPAAYPEFPREEPGQRTRFAAHVIGWAARCALILFQRLPRWIRLVVSIWLISVLLSKGCTATRHRETNLSPAEAQKLKTISDQYQGSTKPADIAKLGALIARELAADGDDEKAAEHSPLLALPFSAAAGDAAAEKLADAAFAQVYGRVSIAHPKQVGLSKDSAPPRDVKTALERGRANHSSYVLWGTVEEQDSTPVLVVKILNVDDGSVHWSKSFSGTGADPEKIAAEVNSNVPALETD